MTEVEKEKFRDGIFFQKIPKDDWLIVSWAIALKALLFVFGAKAVMVFDNRTIQGVYGWLEIWNRWDARHYLEIARTGYKPGADLVVYPVFPMVVRAVSLVLRDDLYSALLVSAAALIAGLVIFRRLLRLDYSPDVAVRAAWFLLIFPTAYFLQVGYTESLFLVFVFGSLLASRVDRWWLAGVLGMFAAMTRASGLALLPTLAVEAGHQFFVSRKWRWSWCWLFLVIAGAAVFLAVNWSVSGDWFAFVKERRDVFRTSYDWPWVGLGHAMSDLHRLPSQAQMVGSAELYFVILTLVCAVVSWIRLRPAYATWITVNLIGFTSLSFIQSAPRYTLVCFPIFILMALLAEKRFWLGILSAGSLLFFAFFAILFARGWWAF